MPQPWKPSPALKLSFALHGAAALGLVAAPAAWPWALGTLGLNHLALTAAGLLPRSSVLGPNLTRLPPAAAGRGEIALTIDDGPDPEVTPRFLDLLDAAGVRASFFCIGCTTTHRNAPPAASVCRALLAVHIVQGHLP